MLHTIVTLDIDGRRPLTYIPIIWRNVIVTGSTFREPTSEELALAARIAYDAEYAGEPDEDDLERCKPAVSSHIQGQFASNAELIARHRGIELAERNGYLWIEP